MRDAKIQIHPRYVMEMATPLEFKYDIIQKKIGKGN